MKTVLTIPICLLLCAVAIAQLDWPMPYTRKTGEVILITGHPPIADPPPTHADVRRMIDSAITELGGWQLSVSYYKVGDRIVPDSQWTFGRCVLPDPGAVSVGPVTP